MSLPPVSSVSVFLPDGTQLLIGGIGVYDDTSQILTCGTFTGPVFPQLGEGGFIILFLDNSGNWQGFLNCKCTQTDVYTFALGVLFFLVSGGVQPIPPPYQPNVTDVSVSAGYSLLANGTGNWDQQQSILSCGTFNADNLPIQDGNGYVISFTDSTGNPQNYDYCSCTASGAKSVFSLGNV